MGVADVVFAVVYSVLAALLGRAVWRHGFLGVFEALKGGMRRVVEGPMPRKEKADPWAITYPLDLLGRIEDLDYPIEDVVAEIEALEEGRAYRMPKQRKEIETPVVRQGSPVPEPAAPPAETTILRTLGGQYREVRHPGEASNVVPLLLVGERGPEPVVADYLGGEAVNLPTKREQFDLLGGPYAGRTVVVLNRPRVIVLQGVPYAAITDPDSGAFLGGYAVDGWDVPCEVCNRHPHRPEGTVLDPRDHQYRPSQEYLRLREGSA
jgi:hypothetical protein